MVPHFTDHAANERTHLAWVRTAISMMAFGFLLERFDVYLIYITQVAQGPHPPLHTAASEWLGLGLLACGALTIIAATLRFYRNRRLIQSEDVEAYAGGPLVHVISILLVVMAIFLVAYVARQVALIT
ncbi:MAG TPA: DUF202 domain-containing protein [Luteibacter sp.]|nr:DUF202 domain-containing protein [Luteibacter sp.]